MPECIFETEYRKHKTGNIKAAGIRTPARQIILTGRYLYA